MQRGLVLVEMLLILVLLSLLLGVAAPRLATANDRAAVRAARLEIVTALGAARDAAIVQGARVALRIDAARGLLVMTSERGPLAQRSPGPDHHVAIEASRDSIAFGPSGRGYGAANTSIVIHRGAVAETVVVSRLGRVR